MIQDSHDAEIADPADDDRLEWTRGALYALALACRLGATEVAEEGLGALRINTRAELEATGIDEYDMSPLRRLLWANDQPKPPESDAWMLAHHDGDGWYLHWADDDGADLGEIEWPFGEDELEAEELGRLGFEVV